jgi:RNA polymerase-binding transcription factor DksA
LDRTESEDFDAQRESLLVSQDELRRRLRALGRDTRTALDKDSEEQATELENRDVAIALGDEARTQLAAIEKALRRLDEGHYGACVRCGERINPQRLSAYPAAIHCIACASA